MSGSAERRPWCPGKSLQTGRPASGSRPIMGGGLAMSGGTMRAMGTRRRRDTPHPMNRTMGATGTINTSTIIMPIIMAITGGERYQQPPAGYGGYRQEQRPYGVDPATGITRTSMGGGGRRGGAISIPVDGTRPSTTNPNSTTNRHAGRSGPGSPARPPTRCTFTT